MLRSGIRKQVGKEGDRGYKRYDAGRMPKSCDVPRNPTKLGTRSYEIPWDLAGPSHEILWFPRYGKPWDVGSYGIPCVYSDLERPLWTFVFNLSYYPTIVVYTANLIT